MWNRLLGLAMLLMVAACGKGAIHDTSDYYVPPHPDIAGQQVAGGAPAPASEAANDMPQATGQEIRVGFLVPLSGSSAEMGQSLLDAGMLALFDKYSTMPAEDIHAQVVLIPKDTEGTPKGAAKAAEQAIAEGVRLIIGPLFADEVRAVAPIAAKSGVNVITFSNNRDVAEKGVFLFGFMPEEQVERVLAEAFARHKSRVGALLPANAYGNMVADALRRMTILYNKPLVGIEFYPPAAPDMDNEIQRLLGGRVSGDAPPVDTLLLAEGGERLGVILSRLSTFGVTNANVQLLGTGVWDDADLAQMPGLAGGWFASSPPKSYHGFEQRFMHNYNYTPPRLASLAYDAVALAATLAQTPAGSDFSSAALTDPSGYSGPANGIFRFSADGVSTRGLAVLEVGKGEIHEISPAPRAFTQ